MKAVERRQWLATQARLRRIERYKRHMRRTKRPIAVASKQRSLMPPLRERPMSKQRSFIPSPMSDHQPRHVKRAPEPRRPSPIDVPDESPRWTIPGTAFAAGTVTASSFVGVPLVVWAPLLALVLVGGYLAYHVAEVLTWPTPDELEERRQERMRLWIMADLPPLPKSYAEDVAHEFDRRALNSKQCHREGHSVICISTESGGEYECVRCGKHVDPDQF